MNRYEQYIAHRPQAKNTLRLGMTVILNDGQVYVVTEHDDAGRFWGVRQYHRPVKGYPGWHWDANGVFHNGRSHVSVNWELTKDANS